MTTQTLATALLWCFVINYGILILWLIVQRTLGGFLYRMVGWFFKLTPEQFDHANYMALALYKVAVILFNLVPYVALRIAS